MTVRAPFPYFGSKRIIAAQVWEAIGDVASYCEPFAGSAAVLLARPGGAGRIETINDLNGFVCNFWRAVKFHRPGLLDLADRLDYPVIEIDLHSRHRWLVDRGDSLARQLGADPEYVDIEAAAWWAWGLSAWFGSGWCSGRISEQVPWLGHGGQGVHSRTINLKARISALCERMRRVRVMCGDWRRITTAAGVADIAAAGRVGVFLDPPYLTEADGKKRTMGLYGKQDSGDVALEVAAWARGATEEHPTWRIVIAGYDGEHDLPGWHVVAWDTSAGQWNSGGYGRGKGNDAEGNTKRERLWLSPACNVPSERGQRSLF